MRKLTLFVGLLFSIGFINAQSFVTVDAGFQGLEKSAVDWGDYDNDGDLDVVMCGMINNSEYVTNLYRNDQGSFTLVDAGIAAMHSGTIQFGDYDADNDLDLILTGVIANGPTVYNNDNGVFTPVDLGIMNGSEGSHAEWGDYDNDGDLDVIVAGDYLSFIYRNDGDGPFYNILASITGLSNSTMRWVDFDNDGDQDLLMQGHNGLEPSFYAYENIDGVFTDIDSQLLGLMSGDIAVGDFDNDGDQDIFRCGYDLSLIGHSIMYRNDGNGAFKNLGLELQEAATSSADWADMDNDGDLDLLVSGRCIGCGVLATNIYYNNSDYTFSYASQSLVEVERCAVSWVDYDNDGDPDVFISGENSSGNPVARLYQNNLNGNTFATNQNPSVPSDLVSEVDGRNVSLSWDDSSDDFTPAVSLSYNICVGNESGQTNVMIPLADTDNGYRYVTSQGNASIDNLWKLIDLPNGTYYWRVQAVDNVYGASAFSEEQYFTVTDVAVENNMAESTRIYPNPASGIINISADEQIRTIVLIDLTGRVVLQQSINQNDVSLNLDQIHQGIYFVKISYANGMDLTRKVIRE
ncbi:MAG: T9SS type A sorting domain-containing protein [Bacteroidales bacterium]|nr:T9SS type A sorting domain-containing protein [Bacteroidales bacterium]